MSIIPTVLTGALLAGLVAAASPATAAVPPLGLQSVGQVTGEASSGLSDKYWGLPVVIGGSPRTAPRKYSVKKFRGYRTYAGSKKYLPGFHPKNVKVKRGHRPKLLSARLSTSKGRYRLKATVRVRGALIGKARKRGVEQLLVSTRVSGATVRHQAWINIKSLSPKRKSVTVVLTKKASRTLARMSRRQQLKSVVVDVVQIIDVDRKKVSGRWTADHLKATSFDLASMPSKSRRSLAASYKNQGFLLTLANNDYYPATATWAVPNLVTNTVSCMESSGSQGSNTGAFNIAGMTPGQTVEAYLQANGGAAQPSNQAPVSQDVKNAMTFDIAESSVEAGLGIPLTWTGVAFDAFEELAKLTFDGCDVNPALFTMSASDNSGNSTSQGYSLFGTYNDGPYPNSDDGDSKADGTDKIGGMADVVTAYQIWSDYCTVYANEKESCGAANYLKTDYIQNNYSVGPQNAAFVLEPVNKGEGVYNRIFGSGGDNGLSLQASNFSFTGTYPQGQLTIQFDQGCSSYFGGVYQGNSGKGDVVAGDTVVNGCAGWPNAPVGNPYPEPSWVSGAVPTVSTCQADSATPVTLSNGTWNVPDSQLSYQWYASSSPANSVLLSAPGSNWMAIPGATASTISPQQQLAGLKGGSGYVLGVVTGSNLAGSTSMTTGAVALEGASTVVPPFATSLPTLSTAQVVAGQPVSVNGGYCPSNGTDVNVTWYVDGLKIVGTGTSYTPTSNQVGASLTAIVGLLGADGSAAEYATIPTTIQAG